MIKLYALQTCAFTIVIINENNMRNAYCLQYQAAKTGCFSTAKITGTDGTGSRAV